MFFNGSVTLTTPDKCALSNKTSRHFIYRSESELFTGDRLQLQLYKTSESIRVIDLHLVSVQEVKKTDVLLNFFFQISSTNFIWLEHTFFIHKIKKGQDYFFNLRSF